MKIQENENFKNVVPYKYFVPMEDILMSKKTNHNKEKKAEKRISYAKKKGYKQKEDRILYCFLVDKGHKEGPEIHCLSKCGVIYILNEKKYKYGMPALITVLFARPEQYKRLLDIINEEIPPETKKYCSRWKREKVNEA